MKLNRKFIYIFVVLVVGLFVISACQSEVGIRPAKKLVTSGSDITNPKTTAVGEVVVDCGKCRDDNNNYFKCDATTGTAQPGRVSVSCSPSDGCTGDCLDSATTTYGAN